MKKGIIKYSKTVVVLALTLLIAFPMTRSVSADEAADAQQAQLLLLMQTPEYQAALALQQQQALALQQQQALQQAQMAQYLAAFQAQKMNAWNDQLAAAQQVLNNAQYLQMSALNQAYILNSIQAQQRMQYEGMINRMGLDYKGMLMQEFKDGQYDAIQAFKGYNGL
ncbi:MAG: hypothetical protein K6D90_10865 [Lachnospiraceae bacterium]|nr:hypothetical protein [Lachnospiraceae bacterium]